jgi:uracil-DNA glycosylase
VKLSPGLVKAINERKLWEPSPFSKKGWGKTGSDPIRNLKGHPFAWRHLRFWQTEDWTEVKEFLKGELEVGRMFNPQDPNTKGGLPFAKIFRALVETDFKDVKIVILGQDPYPNKKYADGLAFSVPPNISKLPPSLTNILAEYKDDLGFPQPRSGDLSTWARRGILLINSVWTCREEGPRSHEKINGKQLWQLLTIDILRTLSRRKDKLVFILWGREAQSWGYMIDKEKHTIIEGAHPSPWNRTPTGKHKFLGGKYFSRACEALGIDKSIWRLP